MNYRIPFNRPFIVGKELFYMAQAVVEGHTAGDGHFTRRCESALRNRLGVPLALITTSCTAALEMAALLCGIESGDEVILPSYTFVSTANAFYLRGAKLVFVEIRPDTLNLDETRLADAISSRTKAIVPVHYAGVACEMDVIMRLARKHELYVIEDAAQAIEASYKGTPLGTLGDVGTFSFHETKSVICGEGGALVSADETLCERAEIVHEKGTNRKEFFRGEVDKYTWVDVGSSYAPSDLLAAFLYAQLEHVQAITARRRSIYEYYRDELGPLAARGLLTLPSVPEECGSNYTSFHVLMADEATRAALIEHLKSKGILAVFHYVPLHTSPMGARIGYGPGDLPVTEGISKRVLRLPLYYDLNLDDRADVVREVFSFFGIQIPRD